MYLIRSTVAAVCKSHPPFHNVTQLPSIRDMTQLPSIHDMMQLPSFHSIDAAPIIVHH